MVNALPLLPAPRTILFDWHGTLVDTLDAMFATMEEMLPQLESLGLVEHLLPESLCKTAEDVKLVRYIRIFRRLHPKILAEGRVSRTEIFNAIFGDNQNAKRIAHEAYNRCYHRNYGKVKPIQEGVGDYLISLKSIGLNLGVATNRSREFLNHELQIVDSGKWGNLFDSTVCADDIALYKPNPEIINHALNIIRQTADLNTWYIGDGYLDILTAKKAGVTAIFYNGTHLDQDYIHQMFSQEMGCYPDAIIQSFDELMDLIAIIETVQPNTFSKPFSEYRPPFFPPPAPHLLRVEADWHPSVAKITPPKVILFDWHATLVDTLDAMYHAVDDMLPELKEKGLLDRMVNPNESKTPEDAKLVEHVSNYAQLHPRVKADRKISRTDIFEVLFGDDNEAKQVAHRIFTKHYRNHFGTVLPFEPQVKHLLIGLKALGITLGIITNRDREFFEHELLAVENEEWKDLFEVSICGDDTELRKPNPDQLYLAANKLGVPSDQSAWYVGDSTTDVISSKQAGMTSVFFNGAQWDLPWLQKIFPGTNKHPHQPDVAVNDFSEFWALTLACLNKP